jgi:hypothetical protein
MDSQTSTARVPTSVFVTQWNRQPGSARPLRAGCAADPAHTRLRRVADHVISSCGHGPAVHAAERSGPAPGEGPCRAEARGLRLGLHNLDIDTIVGSVGRVGDFDRWFRPRRPVNRQRWEALDRASRTGAILHPIEVYKVGHLHFVRDGHHRVSIARAHGVRTIDALVTEVATTLPPPP